MNKEKYKGKTARYNMNLLDQLNVCLTNVVFNFADNNILL